MAQKGGVASEPYQLVLPLNLERRVPDDVFVRLLSRELEALDYSLLYQAYSAKGRNPAVDPKTMFKILTYAYPQNIYSSRKIETRMNRSIRVEGAFGVLKIDYEFQRFLLRRKKVKLEILLLSMGYNLNKLHAKIQALFVRNN